MSYDVYVSYFDIEIMLYRYEYTSIILPTLYRVQIYEYHMDTGTRSFFPSVWGLTGTSNK